MRILLHSPKDLLAGSLAFAAVGAIVANAMFMQAGHHPSPMFGSSVVIPMASLPANPMPRPRPVEADTTDVKPGEQGGIESKARAAARNSCAFPAAAGTYPRIRA